MIFDQTQENLNAWKTQMHQYQKGKRTKRPFGRSVHTIQRVTHEQIKKRQSLFNPVLQTFQRQQDQNKYNQLTENRRTRSLVNSLKNSIKYQKDYDIVNLNSNHPYVQKKTTKLLGPIRNPYNVINNQKMPDFFFQNREMRLPIERHKRLLKSPQNQYDIIKNIYNQAHQQRVKDEIAKQEKLIKERYRQTHEYDPVYGKFYDQERQKQYQRQRIQKQLEHGKDAYKNLPPSYVFRQPFIADYTKPLPETVKMLDQKNANAKKRYQTKYIVLDQYQKRNEQQQMKQEKLIKNHVHFGRILDEKAKQFNIITNNPYKESRAEQLFNKKLQVQSWDVLIKEASKAATIKPSIKTSGFA